MYYEVRVSASTKSLSTPPKVRVGDKSETSIAYLPMNSCVDNRVDPKFSSGSAPQELSAGMIGGAICAVLFLLLAVIGFIVWRYVNYTFSLFK